MWHGAGEIVARIVLPHCRVRPINAVGDHGCFIFTSSARFASWGWAPVTSASSSGSVTFISARHDDTAKPSGWCRSTLRKNKSNKPQLNDNARSCQSTQHKAIRVNAEGQGKTMQGIKGSESSAQAPVRRNYDLVAVFLLVKPRSCLHVEFCWTMIRTLRSNFPANRPGVTRWVHPRFPQDGVIALQLPREVLIFRVQPMSLE